MPIRVAPRQHLECGSMEWIHLTRNLPQDIAYLERRFHFHPIDLRETLPPLQRHKLVIRDGYIFMILVFPIFDPKTRIVSSAEIDFFIGPNFLVTVNDGSLAPVRRLFETCKRDIDMRTRLTEPGITQLLSTILGELLESIFPMLLHLSNDIDEVEKDLFKENQRRVIMEILRIKTNIVNVRKAMQGHKKVIETLLKHGLTILPAFPAKDSFKELIEHAKEIWDTLELQRDTINALHETHTSLLENRTNDIIKTLTMFSVTIFLMTLTAAIFAMEVPNLPLHDDPIGFLKIMGIFVIICGTMLAYFKKRRWL